jgi:hypothetical protein
MYALTLTAPWGSLVAIAAQRPELGKHWETRSWKPRGLSKPLRFAIHQGKNLKPVGGKLGLQGICADAPFWAALDSALYEERRDAQDNAYPSWDVARLPLGKIVAVATLAEVGRACWGYEGHQPVPAVRRPDGKIENVPQPELSFGDYTPGRLIWRLVDIIALPEPVEAQGKQGLWMLGGRAAAAVAEQIGAAS